MGFHSQEEENWKAPFTMASVHKLISLLLKNSFPESCNESPSPAVLFPTENLLVTARTRM